MNLEAIFDFFKINVTFNERVWITKALADSRMSVGGL